jgi:hypothetical protein
MTTSDRRVGQATVVEVWARHRAGCVQCSAANIPREPLCPVGFAVFALQKPRLQNVRILPSEHPPRGRFSTEGNRSLPSDIFFPAITSQAFDKSVTKRHSGDVKAEDIRESGRADEGIGPENRSAGDCAVGSNPTSPAKANPTGTSGI